jgi:MFS family permease
VSGAGDRLTALRAIWSRPWSTTRVVSLAIFFSSLYFYLPVISLFWRARGVSLAEISILQAVFIGVGLVFDLPTGALADLLGRRWALTAGLGFQIVSEFIFLYAHQFWTFAVAQVLGGMGAALCSGSIIALIYESLPERDRRSLMQRAMGAIGAVMQLGSVIAYVVGGLLVANLRMAQMVTAIQLTILCLVIAFGFSLFVTEPKRTEKQVARGSQLLLLMRSGLGLLRQNRHLQRIVLAYLLTNAFPWYLQVLYQFYLLGAGVSGAWLGPALAIGSVLALIGQRYAFLLEEYLGVRRAVLLATALPGVLYLLMAASSYSLLAVLLFCLQWGAISIKEPLFAGYLNAHIPSEQRATVLSLVNTLKSIYIGAMGLVVGRIAEVSLPIVFVAMGVLVLAGALVLQIDERHTDGDEN